MKLITFRSPYQNLLLHLSSEKLVPGADGVVHKIPARLAKFEVGQYVTSNEREIEIIRKTPAYRRKEVFEIKGETREIEENTGPIPVAEAKEIMEKAPGAPKTIRGPVSGADIHDEVAPPKEKPGKKFAEKSTNTTKCKVCGKEFENDLGEKKIRMHMVSHRTRVRKKT